MLHFLGDFLGVPPELGFGEEGANRGRAVGMSNDANVFVGEDWYLAVPEPSQMLLSLAALSTVVVISILRNANHQASVETRR